MIIVLLVLIQIVEPVKNVNKDVPNVPQLQIALNNAALIAVIV